MAAKKYKDLDLEKELKHIWNLRNHFEIKKELEIVAQLETEYFTKLYAYNEKRREMSDNYIFKGDN